jgi:hypothetical protein
MGASQIAHLENVSEMNLAKLAQILSAEFSDDAFFYLTESLTFQ